MLGNFIVVAAGVNYFAVALGLFQETDGALPLDVQSLLQRRHERRAVAAAGDASAGCHCCVRLSLCVCVCVLFASYGGILLTELLTELLYYGVCMLACLLLWSMNAMTNDHPLHSCFRLGRFQNPQTMTVIGLRSHGSTQK